MSYLVQFANVGRGKASWSAELKSLTHDALYREVKKHGGILSSCVDFDLNDDERTGEIIVGGFRAVGSFSWEVRP